MYAFPAERPELVRSYRRDEEERLQLKEKTSNVCKALLGQRKWLLWSTEIACGGDFFYKLLTTGLGLQSLGEEYLSLIQITGHPAQVPSFSRRLTVCALESWGYYFVNKALDKANSIINNNDEINETAKSTLLRLIAELKKGIAWFERLHLAIFYIFGSHYEVSKRIAGVKYLSLRPYADFSNLNKLFRWLGYFTFFQICISGIWALFAAITTKKAERARVGYSSTVDVEERFICPLCINRTNEVASTLCGHLFCWSCICVQAVDVGRCPLCRQGIELSRIVPLINF